MLPSKGVGLAIVCGSLVLMVLYGLAIAVASLVTLQITALVLVLLILGILAWIGYTMYTEPPSPTVTNTLELENAEPEDINPPKPSHPKFSVMIDAEIGEGTEVRDHVNLFRCKIGRNCKIESFVYVEEGVTIGDNCKIKPQVFIPTGVTIQDDVFIGPNVTFTNDKHPRVDQDWNIVGTIVEDHASIGANSVILPGVRIGRNSMVGAGSVVTADVPENTTVVGNPAKPMVK